MRVKRCFHVGLSLMTAIVGLLWVATLRGDNAFPVSGYYLRLDLVSNEVEGNGRVIDPWGIAYLGSGPFWINDEGTGFSSVYFGDGTPYFNVEVPAPQGPSTESSPTALVANGRRDDFRGDSFIFATETGTISGWRANFGPTAKLRIDRSAEGAIYTGLALGRPRSSAARLFAANFGGGVIESYDSDYRPLPTAGEHFVDPALPAGFAPFGIANLKNRLWVTYALPRAARIGYPPPAERGFIDVFDLEGALVTRFASGGALNSPWGLVVAPKHFGQFSNDLLVGNFGDGTISAFDFETGEYRGELFDASGSPVMIKGLWGLIFGNDGYAGSRESLFYTAGPNYGRAGVFGRIDARLEQ